MIVIDSSALIALVKKEPGAERVEAAIGESIVSIVVLTECLSKLALQGLDPEATKARLLVAGLRVEPFGDSDMSAVIALHRLAKQNISLADRFCLALALDRDLPVLTGDRPWADLGLPLEIELIR
jgi:ribonuclease VapC